MLASHLRDRLNRIAQPVGRAVGRSGISANALTVTGLVLVTVGTVMFAGFHSLYFGAVVVGIGGITDMVDGAVAKATGTESRFGAFLDSTTDRLSDGVLFSGIVWFLIHHPSTGTNTLGIPPSIAILLGLGVLVLGFLTSYIKGRAEAMGYTCNVGVAERGERVFIAACSIFLHVIVPALALLFVLSAVTVVQRFVHVWGQADTVKGP